MQSQPLIGGAGTTSGQRQSEGHQEREPRTIHDRCLFWVSLCHSVALTLITRISVDIILSILHCIYVGI